MVAFSRITDVNRVKGQRDGRTWFHIATQEHQESYVAHGVYQCTCRKGYSGVNCAADVDECGSSPCQNKGVCRHSQSANSPFVPGYVGKNTGALIKNLF